MKSSIVVPIQDVTTVSPFSPDDDIEVNFEKAAQAGYDGIELAITDPTHIDKRKITKLLERYKLEMPAIATGQAYKYENISLMKAIERMKQHIPLARELGAVIIIDLIRGEKKNKYSLEFLVDTLRICASFDHKVRFVLEPINRYETELINTVDEALNVINIIGRENIGILFDTFHANIEESSIKKSLQKVNGSLLYVHIADSNRWAPGYGHIDFSEISRVLSNIGYQGFITLESLPKPSYINCLQESAKYIKEL